MQDFYYLSIQKFAGSLHFFVRWTKVGGMYKTGLVSGNPSSHGTTVAKAAYNIALGLTFPIFVYASTCVHSPGNFHAKSKKWSAIY